MQLKVVNDYPESFLTVTARELYTIFPEPALLYLQGREKSPVFLSVLLHGNEDVGLLALQRVLRKYQNTTLPRSLMVFIGNVEAAKRGVRRLTGQPDFNRIWPRTEEHLDTEEHQLIMQVFDYVREQQPFVSIDMHNNTGINPHYACVNRLQHEFFHLASLFSRTVVYFTRPRGVQSLAMADVCPSVTVECGRTGDAAGIDHAEKFLDACLHLAAIPQHPISVHDIDVYHTIATVKVPEHYSFGIDEANVDINFIPNLDHLNFREMEVGTVLAYVKPNTEIHLDVVDENGVEVEQQFFQVEGNQLKLTKSVMPSMFTLDKRVIRQDCLGYLMERYPLADVL